MSNKGKERKKVSKSLMIGKYFVTFVTNIGLFGGTEFRRNSKGLVVLIMVCSNLEVRRISRLRILEVFVQ